MPGRIRAAWAGVAGILLAMLARMGWLDWAVSPPFTEGLLVIGGSLLLLIVILAVVGCIMACIGAVAYVLFNAARALAGLLSPATPAKQLVSGAGGAR